MGMDCPPVRDSCFHQNPDWESDRSVCASSHHPFVGIDEHQIVHGSNECYGRLIIVGKLVFYAFLLMAGLIILSRFNAFKVATGAVTSGGSTLVRTFTGQNTAGTGFIPAA